MPHGTCEQVALVPFMPATSGGARFTADGEDAVILITGRAIFRLALAVGIVIDATRGFTVDNRLQGAVDKAALAAAKSVEDDDNTIENAAAL